MREACSGRSIEARLELVGWLSSSPSCQLTWYSKPPESSPPSSWKRAWRRSRRPRAPPPRPPVELPAEPTASKKKRWGNIGVFRKTTLLPNWMVGFGWGETPIAWCLALRGGAGVKNCNCTNTRSKQWSKRLSEGTVRPWHDQSLSITTLFHKQKNMPRNKK